MSSWDELLDFVKNDSNVNPSLPEHHVSHHVTDLSQLPVFNTDNLNIKLPEGVEFTVNREGYLPVTFNRLEWANSLSNESLFRSLGVGLIPDQQDEEKEEDVTSEEGVKKDDHSSNL